ncbi:hypothetical protein Tco_1200676 [Tanacetum coccineum]
MDNEGIAIQVTSVLRILLMNIAIARLVTAYILRGLYFGRSAFILSACITWEWAESGKHFITTIINGSYRVPAFSTAYIDDLRTEVTTSSWLNDLRDQVEQTRVLNIVFRFATALGSRLPSMANARAKVAGAGAMLHPVSSSTQMVPRGRMYRGYPGRTVGDGNMGTGMLQVPYDMGGMLPSDVVAAAMRQPMAITASASALANAPPEQQSP